MDWLIAIEFGQVIDGKGEAEYVTVHDNFRYVLDQPDGYLIGFVVDNFSSFDPASLEEIWESEIFERPVIFDVPVLGLECASAGAITTLAAVVFADMSTVDADYFHWAVQVDEPGDEKVQRWRSCLAAGNLKAHFGLGYSLCEVGRCQDAYTHLRRYTELVPRNSWAWCWLGDACVGCGDLDEARKAYEEALQLERAGSFETNAEERLSALGNGPGL
jgi:tetratricopeptide (TPR) repeat protein